jgi:hypothetical protein
MSLSENIAVGTLLGAMKTHALHACHRTICPGHALGTPNVTLLSPKTDGLTAGEITASPSLTNTGPLVLLTSIHTRRCILSERTDSYRNQYHHNPQSSFHNVYFLLGRRQGRRV